MGNAQQLLEQSQSTLAQLTDKRTRLQVQLETAQAAWADLVKQAKDAYGTADLAELQALLARQEKENEEAVKLFAQAVQQFGQQLQRIEHALANPAPLQAIQPAAVPVDVVSAPTGRHEDI